MDLPLAQQKIREFATRRDWNQYHSPKNLAAALSVEASELLEHFQWLSAEESQSLEGEKLVEVSHEMADVFYYLLRMSDVLGVDLEKALAAKMVINEEKYPAELVRGSAKKYTEYDSKE